jgi:hypothetical protein
MTGHFWLKIAFFYLCLGWIFAASKSLAQPISPSFQTASVPEAQADLLAKADPVFEAVSRLSGLPIRDNVPIEFKDHDFFENYYESRLRKQYPLTRQAAVEKAFVLLGFLRPGDNLIQIYLDSFLRSVQGAYDPDTKTLMLADWVSPENQEVTLAHELTHALQDQSFSLNVYFDQDPNVTTDSQFAQSSLIEGQAVAVAADYWTEKNSSAFIDPSGMIELANPEALSRFAQDSALEPTGDKGAVDFSYVYGSIFFQTWFKKRGASGLSALFKNPPTMTEQILHPDTFLSKRKGLVGSLEITGLDQAALGGYSKFWEDSMGEYGLFLVLRQYLDDSKAWKAVDGWRADQLQAYECPRKQPILVGSVLMEGPKSAKLFFNAYRELLERKYGKFKPLGSNNAIDWFNLAPGGNQIYLERSGNRIIFAEGTPPENTQVIRQALLNSKFGAVE